MNKSHPQLRNDEGNTRAQAIGNVYRRNVAIFLSTDQSNEIVRKYAMRQNTVPARSYCRLSYGSNYLNQ